MDNSEITVQSSLLRLLNMNHKRNSRINTIMSRLADLNHCNDGKYHFFLLITIIRPRKLKFGVCRAINIMVIPQFQPDRPSCLGKECQLSRSKDSPVVRENVLLIILL